MFNETGLPQARSEFSLQSDRVVQKNHVTFSADLEIVIKFVESQKQKLP